MTKKVTLDKTEYDQMEKEIERLKSVNEELVKGASVVLDPKININPIMPFDYLNSSNRVYKDILTTRASVPNHKKLQDLWRDLETKIQNKLYEHVQEELAKIEIRENLSLEKVKKEEENLKKKEQDFETVRRRSLETQEKQKEILFKEYQKALDKLEIVKKGYEARPKNRYIAMGVFIGAMLTYLIM